MDLLNELTVSRAQGLFQRKTFVAKCQLTDVVGNCVYISGPAIGDTYQVTTAEPRDGATKMPAMGVIIEKTAPTDCVVQVGGEMKGVAGGLTPGKVVFVAVNGTLTHVIPTALVGQLAYIQSMGVAVSGDVVLVDPNFAIIKRRG
jgi:hypothetical protein